MMRKEKLRTVLSIEIPQSARKIMLQIPAIDRAD